MKISGRVVSRKAISLSRASKLISRFAAVENGSSPAVSIYLHRTSDAFNHLVQFHSKTKNSSTIVHTVEDSQLTSVDNTLDEKKKKMKNKKRKRKKSDDEEN